MDYIIGAITGLINGLFGMGGGIVTLYSLQKKLEDKTKANATTLFVILPLSIVTLFMYGNERVIDINLSIKVAIGAVVGAFIGAKLLPKVKYKFLVWTYAGLMIVSGVMMIF